MSEKRRPCSPEINSNPFLKRLLDKRLPRGVQANQRRVVRTNSTSVRTRSTTRQDPSWKGFSRVTLKGIDLLKMKISETKTKRPHSTQIVIC